MNVPSASPLNAGPSTIPTLKRQVCLQLTGSQCPFVPDLLELRCPPAGLGVGTTSFSKNNFFLDIHTNQRLFLIAARLFQYQKEKFM